MSSARCCATAHRTLWPTSRGSRGPAWVSSPLRNDSPSSRRRLTSLTHLNAKVSVCRWYWRWWWWSGLGLFTCQEQLTVYLMAANLHNTPEYVSQVWGCDGDNGDDSGGSGGGGGGGGGVAWVFSPHGNDYLFSWKQQTSTKSVNVRASVCVGERRVWWWWWWWWWWQRRRWASGACLFTVQERLTVFL